MVGLKWKWDGQWLWLSWHSSCFWLQRSVVRIQSLARLFNEHICCYLLKRRKQRKKDAGNGPIKKWNETRYNRSSRMAQFVIFLISSDTTLKYFKMCPKRCSKFIFTITISIFCGQANRLAVSILSNYVGKW